MSKLFTLADPAAMCLAWNSCLRPASKGLCLFVLLVGQQLGWHLAPATEPVVPEAHGGERNGTADPSAPPHAVIPALSVDNIDAVTAQMLAAAFTRVRPGSVSATTVGLVLMLRRYEEIRPASSGAEVRSRTVMMSPPNLFLLFPPPRCATGCLFGLLLATVRAGQARIGG